MTDAREPAARPAPEGTPPGACARGRRLEGLVRFLAIVLAAFFGSIGCRVCVLVLFALGDRTTRRVPSSRAVEAVFHPLAWQMGAWCGLFLALPAVD